MCGIAGSITRSNRQDLRKLIEDIIKHQIKRGPDQQSIQEFGKTENEQIILGHDRLSIIDLSDSANQPMYSEDGHIALVFNGAIYNFKELRAELIALGRVFRTHSDTEVLMQSYEVWGPRAFSRFFGMFAVGIVNLKTGEVLLVRDRFGVKPLYYYCDSETIIFASTPTILAEWANSSPNTEYLGRGIRLKYYEDETDISPFNGLSSIAPGTFLKINLRDSNFKPIIDRYYDLKHNVEQKIDTLHKQSQNECIDELIEILRDACKIRLRADVPLGLSISGGVDSTAIAALCSNSSLTIQGFSFGSPDDTSSEAGLVQMAANSAEMPIEFIGQNTGKGASELFWKTFRAQMLPFPHTSQMAQYAVFEKARQSGVKVMLGGQGGDEAFMGYRKYFLFQLMSVLRNKEFKDVPWMMRNMLTLLPAIISKAEIFWKERNRYSGSSQGMGSDLLLGPLEHSPLPGEGLGDDPVARQMLDVTRFSLPTLLRYEDRNSMGNSIESRLPFLDHRIIEFGLALPIRLKLHAGMGKYLLRKSMKNRVPAKILNNRDKRGFDTRHDHWIKTGVGQSLRDAIQMNRSSVNSLLPIGSDIQTMFSDDQLATQPQRFAEATSLIWMADPSLKSYC